VSCMYVIVSLAVRLDGAVGMYIGVALQKQRFVPRHASMQPRTQVYTFVPTRTHAQSFTHHLRSMHHPYSKSRHRRCSSPLCLHRLASSSVSQG
jgi:hypothetical protein